MSVMQREREKDLKDIETLMSDARGRRILHRLLKSSGCLDRPQMITDPLIGQYYEGKRSIGFDFFADIMDVAPKKLMVMILEAQEREKNMKALLEAEKEAADESYR